MSLNDAGALVSDFLDVLYVWHVWAFSILRFRSATHSDRTGGYGGGTDVSVYYRHAGAYAVVILTLSCSSAIIPPSLRWDRGKRKWPRLSWLTFILTCGTIGMLTFVVTGPLWRTAVPQAAPHHGNGLYAGGGLL